MTTAELHSSRPFTVQILLIAVAFISIHTATLAGAISLAVFVLFCALALVSATTALRAPKGSRSKYGLCAVALLLVAAGAVLWPTIDSRLALILPPLLGNLLTSAFFAYSLLPGQVPVIVRICHASRGYPLPEGLESYARRVTLGWAILPALLALTALAVLAAFGVREWSWVSNMANPILLSALFVGEHVFRGWRLPQLGKPSIIRTIHLMLDTPSWR